MDNRPQEFHWLPSARELPTPLRCMWAYATKRRCKNSDTMPLDTRTTRAYYCAEHRPVVERLMGGSGR